MWSVALLLFYWIFFLPADAQAYLDPASGNALVSFLIAIFGALAYSIKSVFYKISWSSSAGKVTSSTPRGTQVDKRPVIFTEGKTYWTTFRPIVEEFIAQKQHFRYVTLDIHDPGLTIDSEYMESQRVAMNRFGFSKIAKINTPVMLSTTPNIGSAEYPLPRPVGVQNLVHVFHAMVDVSCYRKGSLDFYDSVLMTGAHEEVSIRLVEQARDLKVKEVVIAGLPCLDDLYRQKQDSTVEPFGGSGALTVLVAPSWGPKGCFNEYGTDFVQDLSAAGYNVIIRLHPHSYVFEPDSVEKWRGETTHLNNVSWDTNPFGTVAMSSADILVSDASSIRFDFAFLYNKPVITLHIPQNSRGMFESDYMDETWADMMASKIGEVVTLDTIDTLVQVVGSTVENITLDKMIELRDRSVANFGNSASAIVDYLLEQSRLLSLSSEELRLHRDVETLKEDVDSLRLQLEQLVSQARGNS